MSGFKIKVREGAGLGFVLSEFLCPTHDRFEAVVPRSADDVAACPECGEVSPWTPSAVHGRVRKAEVVRGKYEKPERKTWLDTRELGEGMDHNDWLDKRAAIRDEQRRKGLKALVDS